MKNDAAASIAKLTGIPQKKIDPLLETKTVSDLLTAPSVIPGITQEQMRRMEALNEFSRAYSAAGHSYMLDTDAGQIARYLYGIIGGKRQENLVVLLYNKNKELIRVAIISKGNISSTMLDPIILGRHVSENGAKHAILAHNHPCGEPTFSQADKKAAAETRTQLAILGCTLEDAYVIGDNTYCNEKTPDTTPIPAARPELVLFPSAQKDQDEHKIQELLSLSTGTRRASIENLIDKGYSISEILRNPQGDENGLEASDAGKISLATKIAEMAITNERKDLKIISSPEDAAAVAAEAASKTIAKAGTLFLDSRHRVVEESTTTWPLSHNDCLAIAKEAYKNNVSTVLLFRVGEHNPVRIEGIDKASANRASSTLFSLSVELVDVIILSKEGNNNYLSLRQEGEMIERKIPFSDNIATYILNETQRRTRR